MRSVGKLATLVLSVFIALAAVMLVRSIPDIKRYLEMRRM